MNIAIDISPLVSGHFLQHRVRGTGFYLENLRKSLLKYCPENNYIFTSRKDKLPNDIDVVHFPYFEPFFITLPVIKRHKTIVTVHDLTPLVFPEQFPKGLRGEIKWRIQKKALKNADFIITDSKSSKDDIRKFTGLKEDKIHIVYLAPGEEFKVLNIPDSKIKDIKKKYNLPDSFALYVGDVTWNKNLPRLLKAVIKINVPLVMVGKALKEENYDRNNPWNRDLSEVQDLASKNANIMRLGFVSTEDLVEIYNLATVFAMPSLYEGFGLPILEAMSCGLPVVTTKEGSLGEVAGDSAFYVDAYDMESIANGIKKVFDDEKLRLELSEKGLENVKKFSWKKTAAQTLKVYESVLGS